MDTALVEFVGEFDISHAERTRDALFAAAQAPTVLVDLSKATYLDSTFLSSLLAFRTERLKHHRTPDVILGATPSAMRLFELTGLDTLFTFAPALTPDANTSTRMVVIGGNIPMPGTSAEFARVLDSLLPAAAAVESCGYGNGVYSWMCENRQWQAHCTSENEIVLLRMHLGNGAQGTWSVESVLQMNPAETSPWETAEQMVRYLSPSRSEETGEHQRYGSDRERLDGFAPTELTPGIGSQ